MRRLLNLPRVRQSELHQQFSWLRSVHIDEPVENVKVLSVSAFDHWLTRAEACELLENVSPAEQVRRNAVLARFCSRLVDETEVLTFALRGRRYDTVRFRKFTSTKALSAYCTPNGGKSLGHRHFHIVLPKLACAFYESWDSTYHFYFSEEPDTTLISQWAHQSGCHVLSQC